MNGGIVDGSARSGHLRMSADVAIVGSGAGGSIAAARLAAAGLRVVVLEEGLHLRPDQFTTDEAQSYARLYQEGAARSTSDGAIRILQGRSVGGGTTVNWMTSLRVPDSTLQHWASAHQVEGVGAAELAPHFAAAEQRLSVHIPSDADISPSNRILQRGLDALGWRSGRLPRNTHDCTNIGRCGLGCPIDAKRTATLTWLSDATDHGATVVSRARVTRVVRRNGRAAGVDGVLIGGDEKPIASFSIDAPRVIAAGGAINTPALLLRSGIEHPALGRRTWLHPVFAVLGEYDEAVEPWKGSPQSIASDQFFDREPHMGFFIEAPPIYPVNAAGVIPAAGRQHRELMSAIPHAAALITLCIDGFHRSEKGGTVRIDRNDRIRVDYPISKRLAEAGVAAITAAARIHLAAGARVVRTLHNDPLEIRTESELPRISRAPVRANSLTILSAHPMGGCAMGEDRRRAVVDSRGRSHDVPGLWVADGSLFPTSLGVNPMLTIYAVSSLCAESIA